MLHTKTITLIYKKKVDIHYLQEPCPDYVSKAAETVLRIHFQEGPGDILVFLTGKEEIERAGSLITDRLAEYAYLLLQ